jgi:uncharacterized membrane protein YhaH (DUF805 family)
MDFGYLYTSFEGRINRKPFWIGILILAVAMMIVSLIATFVFLGGLSASPTSQALVSLVLLAIICYPNTAVLVKRLHDRNRPGILAAVIWAPSVLQILGQLLGITGEVTTLAGQEVYLPNTLGWIISAGSLVVFVWVLVDLGILRGTQGPNNYGPDPLQSNR